EHLKTGAVEMAMPSGYDVIVDRISHDIPFYRSYLKNAALTGTKVINDPFWWSADDKFFNYALASRLGVAVPRTVLLPHKTHPPGRRPLLRHPSAPGAHHALRSRTATPAALRARHAGPRRCAE